MAVKRIAQYLEDRFDNVNREFMSFDYDETQFQLILSDNVDVIAKSLTCRDWTVGYKRDRRAYPELRVTEEVVQSSAISMSGIDYKRTGRYYEHWVKKAFFIPDKPLIIIKRTRFTNLKRGTTDVTYTAIVYKPGQSLPTETRYYDLEREYKIDLKWWKTKTVESQ